MTTTDHVRIIAEAAGWMQDADEYPSKHHGLVVLIPGHGFINHEDSSSDRILFAAHAVAWAERGGYRVRLNEQAEYYPSVVVEHEYHIVLRRDCDPEDPHDTARATLAAVSEVVGMIGEGYQ